MLPRNGHQPGLNSRRTGIAGGSSSAHSINHRVAFDLACRNLSLAPPGRPLVGSLPELHAQAEACQHRLRNDEAARCGIDRCGAGRSIPIFRSAIFSEFWPAVDMDGLLSTLVGVQINMTYVPYYGCNAQPPLCPACALSDIRK